MSESPDLSPRSSASPAPANANERKRKITDNEDANKKDNTESEASSKRLKRQKFKEKKNAKAAANPDIDNVTGLNTAIGRMDASHLADYVAKQTKKFQPELSVVELEDRRVPGEILVYMSIVTRAHKNEEKRQIAVRKARSGTC